MAEVEKNGRRGRQRGLNGTESVLVVFCQLAEPGKVGGTGRDTRVSCSLSRTERTYTSLPGVSVWHSNWRPCAPAATRLPLFRQKQMRRFLLAFGSLVSRSATANVNPWSAPPHTPPESCGVLATGPGSLLPFCPSMSSPSPKTDASSEGCDVRITVFAMQGAVGGDEVSPSAQKAGPDKRVPLKKAWGGVLA